MVSSTPIKRASATALLAALSLLLTGCFVTPGKFISELTVKNDNSFSFTYRGEIFFLGLSQLAMMGEGEAEFSPDCYDSDAGEERDCTAAEVAEQRADWDAGAEYRKIEQEQRAKQMAMVLGGVDPTDPEAGNELARKLQRQNGWSRVEYAGDGIFNVDYSIYGQLSHDIIFPVIEGVPVPSPFVQVILRDDKQLRINAPGFSNEQQGGGSGSMMAGMMTGILGGIAQEGLAEGPDGEKPNPMALMSQMEGRFTIITDGQILANNTDEGPSATRLGQALNWSVDSGTNAAPTALVKLVR